MIHLLCNGQPGLEMHYPLSMNSPCLLMQGYKKTGQKCPKQVHLFYESQTLDKSTGSGGVFGNLCQNTPQVGQGRETFCLSRPYQPAPQEGAPDARLEVSTGREGCLMGKAARSTILELDLS